MSAKKTMVSDDIKKAAMALRKQRPAYAEILEFYEQVFVAQEICKNQIDIAPIEISDEIRSVKAREKFPLIDISEFRIDMHAATDLFTIICQIATSSTERLATSAQKLLGALDADLDSKTLFSNLLNPNDTRIQAVAKKLNIETNILTFVTYSSVKPALTLCAEQLSMYLDKEDPWQKGYCPICGSPPVLSMLDGEGERSLICSFCWYNWPVKRIFCPFCDLHDSKTFHYFFSKEEKEYRVYTCESCNRYIKTIDSRKIDRIAYPPLEQVVTLHLDMQARQKGFKSDLRLYI